MIVSSSSSSASPPPRRPPLLPPLCAPRRPALAPLPRLAQSSVRPANTPRSRAGAGAPPSSPSTGAARGRQGLAALGRCRGACQTVQCARRARARVGAAQGQCPHGAAKKACAGRSETAQCTRNTARARAAPLLPKSPLHGTIDASRDLEQFVQRSRQGKEAAGSEDEGGAGRGALELEVLKAADMLILDESRMSMETSCSPYGQGHGSRCSASCSPCGFGILLVVWAWLAMLEGAGGDGARGASVRFGWRNVLRSACLPCRARQARTRCDEPRPRAAQTRSPSRRARGGAVACGSRAGPASRRTRKGRLPALSSAAPAPTARR